MTGIAFEADVDSVDIDHTDVVVGPGRSRGIGERVLRPFVALRSAPHIGVLSGMLLVVVGVALLVLAWSKTADLLEVGRQIPWLISAGFSGVGVVVLGLTVINLSAKHADAAERRRQLAELRELLAELRDQERS